MLHELEDTIEDTYEEHALEIMFSDDEVDDRIYEDKLDHQRIIITSGTVSAHHKIRREIKDNILVSHESAGPDHIDDLDQIGDGKRHRVPDGF